MGRVTQCPHCNGVVTKAQIADVTDGTWWIADCCPHCGRSGRYAGGDRGPYIIGPLPDLTPPRETESFLDVPDLLDDDDDLDDPAPSASPSRSGQESPPRRIVR